MKTISYALATVVFLSVACPAWAEDRSIDGAGNSLSDFNRGAANKPMIRHGYSSDFNNGQMITDAQRANARDISNAVSAQSASRPSARGLSDYIWAWGQFVSHDTDLVTSSNGAEVNGSAPIAVNDPLDPLGPNPIPFVRGNYVDQGRSSRLPINEVTSYIDASQVYGSNANRAAALRTDGGTGAKLLTSAGNLLPYNTAGLPNENNGPTPADQLFVAGDVRANENALLTSLHTIFTREHNRLVDVIAAQQPALNSEQQYQLARKLVGAEIQSVTYREFLPALLGSGPTVPKAEGYAYSSNQNATVTTAFSHAAFRYGHSTVSPNLQLADDDGTATGNIPLRNAFFNPSLLSGDPQLIDQLLEGATTQRSQEVDTLVVDDLRNFLFGPPGAGGLDLAALNIQRGRDAGLPDYRQLRGGAHQLSTVQTFGQITSDPALAQTLFDLYGGNINNIDVWVGGLAEDHVPGSSVGPLTKAAIESQFQRLRDGDRLFYRGNAAGLYTGGVLNLEIAAIIDLDALRLSDLILANTSLTDLQRNVFFVPIAGDYNGDGLADAADYTHWRNTLGSTTDMSADGNGDGSVGVEDFDFWKAAFSTSSTASIVGDYNGDGEVDAADYSVWRNTLGSTIDIAADGSSNGTVGTEDFNVWKSHFGQYVVKSPVGSPPILFGVPEPTSAMLVLMAVLLGHCLTRSRRMFQSKGVLPWPSS